MINELLQVLSTEVEARKISEDNGNSNIARVYCKEGHYPASCPKVATILAHRESLRKKGCCFVCLMRGHHSNECQSYIPEIQKVWSETSPISL